MNCESFRKQLPLLLYGELSFQHEEPYESHMEACAACRRVYERERAMHRILDTADLDTPAGLLGQCRRDLRLRLRDSAAPARESFWSGWLPSFPRVLRPAGALALVAAGFFSARLLPPDFNVGTFSARSEEHTSELQSQSNLVCRLLR